MILTFLDQVGCFLPTPAWEVSATNKSAEIKYYEQTHFQEEQKDNYSMNWHICSFILLYSCDMNIYEVVSKRFKTRPIYKKVLT